jgi:heptose I phosphotransferase
VKDLAQLLYSSEVEGVGVRDRVRFWRMYLEDDRAGRWLRTFILLKWRRYRRHNRRSR